MSKHPLSFALAALVATSSPPVATPREAILPNGRTVRPAGDVLVVGNLPFNCALSPDGRYLAVLHGGKNDRGLDLVAASSSTLVQHVALKDSFFGLAWQDERTLFVSGGGAHDVQRLELGKGGLVRTASLPASGYVAGVALASGSLLAVDNTGERLLRIPLNHKGTVMSTVTPPAPCAVIAEPDGAAWVASWGAPLLTRIAPDGSTRSVPVGSHPSAITRDPRTGDLWVANANDDTLSVVDPVRMRRLHTVSVRAYPGAPLSSTPTALAFAPDGRKLYVALAGLNALAVLDPVSGRDLGRIPTAWYPADLAMSPDGSWLYVACAKGFGAGPRPGDRASWLLDGVVQRVSVPDDQTLKAMTREVATLNGFEPPRSHATWLPPIRHVVYVVRENRTYDQELGDLAQADGNPGLTLFGRDVTPNTHALAERFAFGDRFFCDGEVSAQGHQWVMGGTATDIVERMWPPVYAHKGRWLDSDDPLIYPDSDYLIDRCVERGVSCRMYGDYLRKGKDGKVLQKLRGLRSTTYEGWDLDYSDLDRVKAWEAEFKSGTFPAFSHVWLPNDHTAGTKPGKLTPRAMVAQNDLATGQLVDILSHDPRWKDTLVIIQEDDAQAGYDHVDGHRSVLVLASPWIKGGTVTSRHYSQASLVAAVCSLLGLGPLTQYTVNAPVVGDIWSHTPDMRPFEAIAPRVSLTERNAATAPLAPQSRRFDFSKPDAGDQSFLARALWLSVRAGRD